jgi:hypothetical protein
MIVAWGDNEAGQCDIPAPNADFVAVAAGRDHSLGIKSNGTIVAWGNNEAGQCNVPAPNTGFVAVVAGRSHSLGLKSDGTIVAWGNNEAGQCNVPAPNIGFMAVAAGSDRSLAVRISGVTPVAPALEAEASPEGIVILCSVPMDYANVLFRLYRRTNGDEWLCVAPLLRSVGGIARYVDADVQPGIVYEYEIEAMGPSGPAGRWGPIAIQASGPLSLRLGLFPNPTADVARVSFALPRTGDVTLRLFDAAGRELAVKSLPACRAGVYTLDGSTRSWGGNSGRPLPSGTYWMRMETRMGTKSERWVILR